jgi:hypothetical protein
MGSLSKNIYISLTQLTAGTPACWGRVNSFLDNGFLILRCSILLVCLVIFNTVVAQTPSSTVVTTDTDNFWSAYDHITSTTDSSQQYEFLDRLFISIGTPGLKAMMAARSYTNKSYIDAIQTYPLYWSSIRKSMLGAQHYSKEIAKNVSKLKTLYPALKPAKIYFTVGAFKSGGTTMDSLVLIGTEIAMADQHTDFKEFDDKQPGLARYLKTYPVDILVFTNIHEYVHTQQRTTVAPNLLGQCILEGVAEFIAEKATGKSSTAPALNYGKFNKLRIEEVFCGVMFNASNGFWLYSNVENEFNQRDLGYYVGYAICEAYYNKASKKAAAIQEMIELDYSDKDDLITFAEQSGYFKKSVVDLAKKYEASRPTVTAISPVNANQLISNSVTRITVNFSEPMDKRFRNFEFGPLGKENLLIIKKMSGFSDDGRTLAFDVELESNKHYQLLIGPGFRNLKGVALKPYLIDFITDR